MLKQTSPQTESIEHEDGTQEQEVIVHGYKDDTDFKTIEANLKNIIKDLELESRVEKVFTFADPSSIGVIRFKTVPAKFGFYKKLKRYETKSPSGAKLRFENNKSLEERARDNHLGYTKHLLIESNSGLNVEIKWRNMNVEVGGKPVAWFDANSNSCVDGVGKDVKEEVLDMVKSFVTKRRQ